MKRNSIFFVIVLVMTSLIAMQSCKKEAPLEPTVYEAAMPDVPVPANNAIVAFTGANQTVTLSWKGTATNAIKWNVYFGNSSSPAQVASNVATNSYVAHIGTTGGTYYWQVETTDANKVKTVSPVWQFEVNSAPGAASTPSPALNATGVSCTPTITWVGTDPEGDALTYDLILDKTATPSTAVSSGLTSATYTFASALSPNTDYYWKVITNDPYGKSTAGPVWKFTTGALPIATFTGNYLADEPAEAYSYDVSFAMVTSSTIKTTNYWNSNWPATFTLDFTKLTYSMTSYTFAANWTGVESGIIDPATGKMTGTYTLWLSGVIQEQGVHTYTKK